MKMQNEGRKIMHLPELKVSCTCVRVPVIRSHSISVSCHFDRKVTVEEVRQVLADAPGVLLVDDLKNKRYPMPLETSNQDIVFVGRIRPDLTDDNGIISNPNCSTIITITAVNALNKISPIRTMTASTYQAVSGAGAGGPIELMAEVEALREGKAYEPKIFSHQIAYNLIPQIGGEAFEGYTSEEMKMQNEGRKIMHLPDLRVSCTCVRVPVVRSHSISVSCHFDVPVTVEQVREVLKGAPGVKLTDDLSKKLYPMPLDTSDQDLVFVGRIRPDLTDDCGICLWCCGDQVRKGAATNAIQIAELLVK